jgi:hypothetical protein
VHKNLNTKLAHHTTLYKFYKDSRGFDPPILHELEWNFKIFSTLVNSEIWRRMAFLHHFALEISNAAQHESYVP